MIKMKKYTILKGWHYAFFLFGRLFGWYYNKKKYLVRFKLSKECWWTPARNKDDYDLNKLCGISFGLFAIHKNSVRLTWVPNFEKEGYVKIYGYVYDSSKKTHESKYICEIQVDKEYICHLSIDDTNKIYIFDMSPFGMTEMENKTTDNKLQKKAFPYFGGNNRAPVTMYIWKCIKSFI
jgi:hypothetical protein